MHHCEEDREDTDRRRRCHSKGTNHRAGWTARNNDPVQTFINVLFLVIREQAAFFKHKCIYGRIRLVTCRLITRSYVNAQHEQGRRENKAERKERISETPLTVLTT